MKSILITLALTLAGFSLAANNDAKCRELPKAENASPAEMVRLDLLQGIWSQTDAEGNTLKTFQFQTDGRAELILSLKNNPARYLHADWHIETRHHEAWLVWKPHHQSEQLLRVIQTCEGIELVPASGEKPMRLRYYPKSLPDSQSKRIRQLTGEWTNANYPFQIAESPGDCGTLEIMKGAFLTLELRPDGHYLKQWGNQHVELTEQGRWRLSDDGLFILFDAQPPSGDHTRERYYIAKIKLLDMDKVVLEQALESPGFEGLFCTQNKDFLFVK
ncbi:MAG: hypothetical protein D6714_06570 [Bacteroidetes bacterium]|nr:MAG: hypothetical protein D6714_06570 [Bacteroidota bacterium]